MNRAAQKKFLKQYLNLVYEQQGKRRDSLFGLILERGRWFKPAKIPKSLSRGEEGLCYNNAFNRILLNRKLAYVEGYACEKHLPGFPIMHAWVSEIGGDKAYDVTWESGDVYFGIEWPRNIVMNSVEKIEYAGILPNLFMLVKHDDCNPFKEENWK